MNKMRTSFYYNYGEMYILRLFNAPHSMQLCAITKLQTDYIIFSPVLSFPKTKQMERSFHYFLMFFNVCTFLSKFIQSKAFLSFLNILTV